jgi:hypothetical protein
MVAAWGAEARLVLAVTEDVLTDDMSFDEQLRLERQGADAGLNPMFGEWQHRFEFPPVPYGNGAAQRGDFRAAIQAELTNHWLFSNEIHLDITLHVDVQTTLETDESADLDNYAKAILDGLKGPIGIMIDDTQVQALTISWIDGYGPSAFTISAKGSPDEFVFSPRHLTRYRTGSGIRTVAISGARASASPAMISTISRGSRSWR